ncbi:MAG: radical SAM family heme chaperone HemW [Saprospiraceae bacterium]|nr:radical SAM family heme chaperone HemW [Saprospiraceae bacterium]
MNILHKKGHSQSLKKLTVLKKEKVISKNTAGLYLHIPFCKQACHYCNFHFSTSLKHKEQMVDAIIQEIALQKDYLKGQPLHSIYFGGGTPSLLSQNDLERIFNAIAKHHTILEDAEITLEANPDDLDEVKLAAFQQTPINRLSIGIQSFSEEDLRFMNRAHNALEAANCIELAQAAGFHHLTVDLIYGSPTTSDEIWQNNIDKVLAYDIPHISCYCLTVEPKTALDYMVRTGKATDTDEEQSARQFEMLMQRLTAAGYDHYEISNFAKPGAYARHNSSYWLGAHYLGIGPAAHTFNGHSRQWNVANNAKYIKAIAQNNIPAEIEQLTKAQQFNEYIMTSLRTIWGTDIKKLNSIDPNMTQDFLQHSHSYQEEGLLKEKEGIYTLTTQGKLLADRIAMELFIEE